MAIEFRCQKCGKLLSFDTEPGETVRCPHCSKKVAVPEALASLPHPHVVPDAALQQEQVDEEQPERSERDEVIAMMARFMPAVISVFFHAGLALITMLATIIVTGQNVGDEDVKSVKGKVAEKGEKVAHRQTQTGTPNPRQRTPMQPLPTRSQKFSIHQSDSPAPTTWKGEAQVIIGRPGGPSGGPGGPPAPWGPKSPGRQVGFMDRLARADDVVYVIDKSGSMAAEGAFNLLQLKLA
ncbi:MAG: TFIIB-type zinc ribbon-containing protein, partial [Planctomycetota bacterium]